MKCQLDCLQVRAQVQVVELVAGTGSVGAAIGAATHGGLEYGGKVYFEHN